MDCFFDVLTTPTIGVPPKDSGPPGPGLLPAPGAGEEDELSREGEDELEEDEDELEKDEGELEEEEEEEEF